MQLCIIDVLFTDGEHSFDGPFPANVAASIIAEWERVCQPGDAIEQMEALPYSPG